jgi:hypothetical protein
MSCSLILISLPYAPRRRLSSVHSLTSTYFQGYMQRQLQHLECETARRHFFHEAFFEMGRFHTLLSLCNTIATSSDQNSRPHRCVLVSVSEEKIPTAMLNRNGMVHNFTPSTTIAMYRPYYSPDMCLIKNGRNATQRKTIRATKQNARVAVKIICCPISTYLSVLCCLICTQSESFNAVQPMEVLLHADADQNEPLSVNPSCMYASLVTSFESELERLVVHVSS